MRDPAQLSEPGLIPVRPRGRMWPVIVLSLVGFNFSVVGGAAYLASTDNSFAVEPDLYLEARGWDKHRRVLAESVRLGWRCELALNAAGTSTDSLALTLADADGQPISDANVTVEIFHMAYPRVRHTLAPRSNGNGAYVVELPPVPAGMLECRITVRRGVSCFLSTRSIVNPGANSGSPS